MGGAFLVAADEQPFGGGAGEGDLAVPAQYQDQVRRLVDQGSIASLAPLLGLVTHLQAPAPALHRGDRPAGQQDGNQHPDVTPALSPLHLGRQVDRLLAQGGVHLPEQRVYLVLVEYLGLIRPALPEQPQLRIDRLVIAMAQGRDVSRDLLGQAETDGPGQVNSGRLA